MSDHNNNNKQQQRWCRDNKVQAKIRINSQQP